VARAGPAARAGAGGYASTDVDLFFRRPDGQAWHPSTVTDRFKRLARDAGLPPIGIHGGRRGAATYTKAAGGTLLDIKELLGHAHVGISSDIYTSLLEETERELAERTAQLIPRHRPQPAAAPRPRRPQPSDGSRPNGAIQDKQANGAETLGQQRSRTGRMWTRSGSNQAAMYWRTNGSDGRSRSRTAPGLRISRPQQSGSAPDRPAAAGTRNRTKRDSEGSR
jgi:hypothetical protein